jgi:Rod binding domain-containing protein
MSAPGPVRRAAPLPVPVAPPSRGGVAPDGVRRPDGARPLQGPAPAPRAQLRKLAHEMEGVFVAQLFQAMRQTVPGGGVLEPSPGEEMFTGMLDDLVARRAAEQSHRGIGEALYRQLARRLPPEPAGGDAP